MSDEIGKAILDELKKQTSVLNSVLTAIEDLDFPDSTNDVDSLVRINRNILERMEAIERVLDSIESNTGQ